MGGQREGVGAVKSDHASSGASHALAPMSVRRSWTYRLTMIAAWMVMFVALYVGATQ